MGAAPTRCSTLPGRIAQLRGPRRPVHERHDQVCRTTLESTSWRNSTLLGPYDVEVVAALKEKVDGGVYVSGSGTLVHALLADGLVDELHLFVYPVTSGSGPRLFAETGSGTKWSLAKSETYDNGVVYLGYRLETSQT